MFLRRHGEHGESTEEKAKTFFTAEAPRRRGNEIREVEAFDVETRRKHEGMQD